MRFCDAVVVGAGPAGLAAAESLASAGVDVAVLEAASHPGGTAWSEWWEGYLLETGPHTFRGASDALWGLIERLQLLDEVEAMDPRAARYILREGRLYRVPNGPLDFLLSGLLSPRAKWQVLGGLLKAGDCSDRSVAQWMERRFGIEFRRTVIDPIVGGIFASGSDTLDMARSFPRLWQRTGARGRVLPGLLKGPSMAGKRRGVFALRGGFRQLAEAVAERLGSQLHLSEPVQGVERRSGGGYVVRGANGALFATNQLILATPVARLSPLLGTVLPGAKAALQKMTSVPMASVSLGGTGAPPLPPGFGALLPRDEGFRMLGAIHVSALVPERAPAGHWLVTLYLGGRQDPEVLDLDDGQLEAIASEELSRLAARPLSISMARVYRHPSGIPQPDLNSSQVLNAVNKAVDGSPGLQLAGSYLGGVSVEMAVHSGIEAAQQVQKELAA